MCGSWEKIVVDQPVHWDVDYPKTIQRLGDIVERMCGSWEKIVVDQRKCRRILKRVKQCVLPIFVFLRLNTTFSTFLMF